MVVQIKQNGEWQNAVSFYPSFVTEAISNGESGFAVDESTRNKVLSLSKAMREEGVWVQKIRSTQPSQRRRSRLGELAFGSHLEEEAVKAATQAFQEKIRGLDLKSIHSFIFNEEKTPWVLIHNPSQVRRNLPSSSIHGRGVRGEARFAQNLVTGEIALVKITGSSHIGPLPQNTEMRALKLTNRFFGTFTRQSATMKKSEDGTQRKFKRYVIQPFTGIDLSSVRIQTPEEFASLAAAMCYAVHNIHELNILHLDLKPANLTLNIEEKRLTEMVKCIDFGISYILGKDQIDAMFTPKSGGMNRGTPGYIDPKLIKGYENIQNRKTPTFKESITFNRNFDHYALGISLFNMLPKGLVEEKMNAEKETKISFIKGTSKNTHFIWSKHVELINELLKPAIARASALSIAKAFEALVIFSPAEESVLDDTLKNLYAYLVKYKHKHPDLLEEKYTSTRKLPLYERRYQAMKNLYDKACMLSLNKGKGLPQKREWENLLNDTLTQMHAPALQSKGMHFVFKQTFRPALREFSAGLDLALHGGKKKFHLN